MCFHFQNIKIGVQAPLVEIGLTIWQKIWGRAKAWSKISYIFWFLLLASMARKECRLQHFLNVRLFSKVQIWYPSPLGWDRVISVTSDDSVLGRGFISHSPKISCQFATKIRMIRLTFMFTWTKNKIPFCPPLRPDFSKFSFLYFLYFRKSHKKSHNLSTSSCNSCRKLLKLWGQTWNFN